MGKRFHAVIILALICLLCGCADRQGDLFSEEGNILTESLQDAETGDETKENPPSTEASQETAESAESGTKTAESEEASGVEDGIWFMGKDANAGVDFGVEEYDYAFYFRGFYLSYDGKSDQIFVDPIEFVWNWETERWHARMGDDDSGYCIHWNDTEEIIGIPISETTEFHFYNDDDSLLYELSERNKGRECVTTKPEIFLYYLQTQFDDGAERYPFFMILDEDGYVKYVIEYPLV